ncbi:unnamed protein product [Parnassius apollo]|uniref:(apollo) hypothetical protein n=1 Tax=Parnassius apollo TaxID=110799 RepID=A0A8S3X187_PARAO|nr:unnamed protein product [Parnassius apollo]
MSVLSNSCTEAIPSQNLSQEIVRTEDPANITDEEFEEARSESSPNFNDENTIKEEFEKIALKSQQFSAPPLLKPLHSDITPKPIPSYATVVKTTKVTEKPPIPITKPSLIITSKKPVSSSQETIHAWRKSVHFKELTFTPAEVKPVSNHKLRVEFDKQEQRDKILETINRPDSLVSAEIAKKLKPMVILKGIYKDTPVTELVDIITNQNTKIKDLIISPEDIIFKFVRNNKNQKLYNAVFMVAPHIWRVIIEIQKS